MGLILGLLTAPVLGPVRGISWLAQKVAEEMERPYLDEGRVRAELLKLETSYDLGEMTAEEYFQQEMALLERLNIIREAKAERTRRG